MWAVDPWLAVAIDTAAKGSLLLLVAWAVCASFKRLSAAQRHMIWYLAVCAQLVLPLMSLAGSPWRLAILPSWMGVAASDAPTGSSDPRYVVGGAAEHRELAAAGGTGDPPAPGNQPVDGLIGGAAGETSAKAGRGVTPDTAGWFV